MFRNKNTRTLTVAVNSGFALSGAAVESSSTRSEWDESSWRYPGWRVVIMSALAAMAGFGSVLVYSFGVLLKPLGVEFGWSRATISVAFACASFTLGLCSPVLGLLLDRYGPRRVILPCVAIFGIALGSLAFLSGSLVRFYVTFILIGAVGNATAQMGFARTISTWFSLHRGLALAALMGGSGLGSIAVPVITQGAITAFGWRATYAILGAAPLLIALPLVALFVKERAGTRAVDTARTLPGMEVSAALRVRTFWILAVTLLLTAMSTTGTVTHFTAMLSDKGVDSNQAALGASIVGACGIIGRFVTGWLLDRYFGPRVGMILLFITALSLLLLSYSRTLAECLVAGALLGFSMGGEVDVTPYMLARDFGLRRLSTLYGFTWTAYATAAALGSILLGRAFDATGSYAGLLIQLSFLTLIAGLLMIALPRYPAPQSAENPG